MIQKNMKFRSVQELSQFIGPNSILNILVISDSCSASVERDHFSNSMMNYSFYLLQRISLSSLIQIRKLEKIFSKDLFAREQVRS